MYKTNFFFVVLFSLAAISSSYAVSITVKGYGKSEEEAKNEALTDLSNKISGLPIKGELYKTISEDNFQKVELNISKENSIKSYLVELESLKTNIVHHKLQLLKNMKNFQNYTSMINLLNGTKQENNSDKEKELIKEIAKLVNRVDDIQSVSKILLKDIEKKNIYQSAIKFADTKEITEFSKTLKDQFSIYQKIQKYPKNAKYFLKGTYQVVDGGLFILIELSDINNHILKINAVILNTIGYKNIKYKNDKENFGNKTTRSFQKNSNVDVDIRLKDYDRDKEIILIGEETIDLTVKTNKSICYFLVGHNMKQKDNFFSYLIPIGSDSSPFINQITGYDLHKRITILEEIPIIAPFGYEKIQIISSTFKQDGSCPLVIPECIENDYGYCQIDGQANGVVEKLMNINDQNTTVQDSISFRSFAK